MVERAYGTGIQTITSINYNHNPNPTIILITLTNTVKTAKADLHVTDITQPI